MDKITAEERREHRRAEKRAYYKANAEAVKAKAKIYRTANKEIVNAWQRNYRATNVEALKAWHRANYAANKEKIRAEQRSYREANDEILNARRRSHSTTDEFRGKRRALYKNNPAHRLRCIISSRLNQALKGRGKLIPTMEAIGCTPEQLRTLIEAQFVAGMNWDNYGKAWHVDHIRPLASFDLTNPEEYKRASHFSNLRPMWASMNIRKGAKVRHLPPTARATVEALLS